jgi:hypothetical protein
MLFTENTYLHQLKENTKLSPIPIFDRIIGASGQVLGNLGPLGADLLVQVDDQHILRGRPRVLLDVRIEVVVPPLATLPARMDRLMGLRVLRGWGW